MQGTGDVVGRLQTELDEARRERGGMQRLAQKNRAAIDRVRALCTREVDRNNELGVPLRPALYVDEILAALGDDGS